MTNYNERLDEVLSKTPCAQCDGSGAYPDYDGEPVQCQFCWQLRFTFIDNTKQAILRWVADEVIGEDEAAAEYSYLPPALNEITKSAHEKAVRNQLRAEQRRRIIQ